MIVRSNTEVTNCRLWNTGGHGVYSKGHRNLQQLNGNFVLPVSAGIALFYALIVVSSKM
jgi:hypothetical protein